MALIKHESRNRIGIDWYDNEREAHEAAKLMFERYDDQTILDANIGYAQCGRDPGFDLKDDQGNRIGFAVVTP